MRHKYLQEEHHIFRDAFHKFLEKEAYPYYNEWEKEGIIPRAFWTSMGSKGFLCPMVDERYGGAGADFGYSVVINEELEKVGSSLIGIGLHNDIVVPYFTQYGTEEQKKRWLPKCVSGECITAIAMTEPGAGSDLASIRTTARKEGDYYVVNGEKTFITNGIHADLVIVVCKTDTNIKPAHKGMSLLVLERGMEGFKRGKKLKKIGLYSQDTAELIFEDVKVPASNLLGEEGKGFYYLMEKLQQERLIVAIAAKTAAEVMLYITKNYVQERKAFGKSISDFQTVQFRLAEMYTEIEIGRTFVDDCIANHMNGENIVTKVSMAKWWLTDLAKKVSAECIQLHGGYGYMEEYEIARRYRDIPVSAIYAGANEIMKNIIAKGMGL
ncbi:acyl-CoA dehydrogenase family protein [Bacillus pseudomycoides]|uniref:acyl-CoA dehydrogenase family protein n=1 Tax=Bacillus pseudomycoides TaxID=64104 RepID=UPI000BED90E1|nr:acyl-CoA dehydrogenase family protein [Bacillus pseudomycoides]PED06514.1 acyl-CoA dehydrogenase [Bacillus pseudomycoides]PED72504.1 acyl-CoA dehydrogenase [Bacillus pseudomycoides]PEE42591.1 acyl-CoA dehydrogenase [Bacillus pseudomycoides]PEI41612.1 acyl-CoA dehydrogenase [Bacillus pseudomycoides]PEI92859.1 acyl-CoA dehydrogenase [Bacillus pseudomycoides]